MAANAPGIRAGSFGSSELTVDSTQRNPLASTPFFARFVSELQRRRVFRVAAVYGVVAWVVIEVADTVIPRLALPEWTVTLVIVLAALGFPLALVLAWAFDLRSAGIERTAPVEGSTAALATAPVRPGRVAPSAGRIAVVGAVVVLALAGSAFAVLGLRGGPELHAERVAVAVFENRTGDPALTALGAVVADWIAQGLTETNLVEVADARSVMAVAGGARNPRALAEETGAGIIVSGSYFLDGDSIRFAAEITDARRRRLLQGVSPVAGLASAPTAGVEALRQRVLAALAGVLDNRGGEWEAQASSPPSYAAYEAFTEGLRVYVRGDLSGARVHFERAAALDTTFLRALVWAAQCYAVANELSPDGPAAPVLARLEAQRDRLGTFDRARLDFALALQRSDVLASGRAARRMLETAPGSTDALREVALAEQRAQRPRAALEAFHRLDPEGGLLRGWNDEYWFSVATARHLLGEDRRALRELRRFRQGNPQAHRAALAEAIALAGLGRTGEAVLTVESFTGWANSHAWATWLNLLAAELRAHGDPAAARRVAESVVELLENREIIGTAARPGPRSVPPLPYALLLAGRTADARRVAEAQLQEFPDVPALAALAGIAAAQDGDAEGARRHAATLEAMARQPPEYGRRPGALLGLAQIAAVLGERQAAIARLRDAIAAGHTRGSTNYMLHSDPAFESLRGDPAFEKLLEPDG
jgi:TolB-like protein/tetratricopeptide (TPR) repeat protein